MNVRAAVANIDDAIPTDLQIGLQTVQGRYLAIPGSHVLDGRNLTRRVIAELRPENVIRGNNVLERRLNHFHRSRGNHVELEPMSRDSFVQDAMQEVDILLQANALAHFPQVLGTHAVVKLRIVQQQVGQLSPLLHEIEPSHALGLALEFFCRNAEQLAQHVSRVVVAQRLIEITGKYLVLYGRKFLHTLLDRTSPEKASKNVVNVS